MSLGRKDTIIIAVLMNVALLTVLFITAMQFDEEPQATQTLTRDVADSLDPQEEPFLTTSTPELPADEVDQVLKVYAADVDNNQLQIAPKVPPVEIPKPSSPPSAVVTAPSSSSSKSGEVVVKKGDSLDKIARVNKTTVKEIKRLNQLTSDNLKVGQKLVIPAQTAAPKIALQESLAAVYHEVKSGDSPWKIAKKYNMSYEDILELNHLDDAKARNLKIGDKLRIK